MEKQPTRRAALSALASVPALAILPAAASPPSTTALANLIEEHRAAWAAFGRLVEALEAAEPDGSILVPCLASEPIAVKGQRREGLINIIEDNFKSEAKKLRRLTELSPELGGAALERLEGARDACRARLEEVFADYRVVEDTYDNAGDAEDDALMAICAHRCASLEEAAIRARYLTSNTIDLQTQHIDALFASFLPEGEDEFETA
jgi:hypothetical protein